MGIKWATSNIPDLTDKVAVVTGGNTGLGYKTSLELSRRGASVIIACRSPEKGRFAVESILKEIPRAKLEIILLDLLDSDSISNFAQNFNTRHNRLDMLINNAGVVNLEKRQVSSSGHEMHMATNHLGHFALTGRLFPALIATEIARVVTVSSIAYKTGTINFDDLDWQKREYNRFKSYGDSKLANLLFMKQLQKIFDSTRATAISVAAHPGITATERQQTIGAGGFIAHWLASPVSKGCLPQLLAATEPSVKAGQFYGPKYGIWGYPSLQKIKPGVLNSDVAEKLWRVSEDLTHVKYGHS